MKAWHFCRNNRKLGYGDTRRVKTGRTYKVKGKLVLCKHGLHGSVNILDALGYVRGEILCRVELGGEILKGKDKVVASERTVLWMLDCTKILHEFACLCAERGLKRNKITDPRCWDAIKIKRLWLKGEATDEQLAAAWSAAGDVMRDAAMNMVAWNAARLASRLAARHTVAWSPSRNTSWREERDWQNRTLLRMVRKERAKR